MVHCGEVLRGSTPATSTNTLSPVKFFYFTGLFYLNTMRLNRVGSLRSGAARFDPSQHCKILACWIKILTGFFAYQIFNTDALFTRCLGYVIYPNFLF